MQLYYLHLKWKNIKLIKIKYIFWVVEEADYGPSLKSMKTVLLLRQQNNSYQLRKSIRIKVSKNYFADKTTCWEIKQRLYLKAIHFLSFQPPCD